MNPGEKRSAASPSSSPLGLIAGEGVFPLLVARGARSAGRKVICAALAGCAWKELEQECDHLTSVGVAKLGQWIRVLQRGGCSEAILVGRVAKSRMYDRWRFLRYSNVPDFRAARLWFVHLRRDKRPKSVLNALANELQREGITLIDSTAYCAEHLAGSGVMTRRQPTKAQWEDIRYGWEIGQALSRLDVGQSIAVMNRDVIAVEALEGTNAMIERAGGLCKVGGWTLIKVSNTDHDMRLDVPSIGTTTIEKMRAAGAACLVVESARTILLEKPKVLELAERYKIVVVGYPGT